MLPNIPGGNHYSRTWGLRHPRIAFHCWTFRGVIARPSSKSRTGRWSIHRPQLESVSTRATKAERALRSYYWFRLNGTRSSSDLYEHPSPWIQTRHTHIATAKDVSGVEMFWPIFCPVVLPRIPFIALMCTVCLLDAVWAKSVHHQSRPREFVSLGPHLAGHHWRVWGNPQCWAAINPGLGLTGFACYTPWCHWVWHESLNLTELVVCVLSVLPNLFESLTWVETSSKSIKRIQKARCAIGL